MFQHLLGAPFCQSGDAQLLLIDHSERLDEAGHHFHLRSPSFVGEHTLFPPAERASGALSDTGGSTRETGGLNLPK